MKTLITNATIVLRDEILKEAKMLIKDGFIHSINSEVSGADQVIDLRGDVLMPGMIDIHCDALEKEVEPRPNVHFPLDFACAQADKRNAAAGITTVYHALSFAHEELGVRNNNFAAEVARAVYKWQPHALVDNRVHCRYEITDETGVTILKELMEEDSMHMISMMDHTPGQGQFKDLTAYKNYLSRTYKTSDEEIDEIIERKIASASGAFERMSELTRLAHQRNLSVASHDDESIERIATMREIGADISEFPINLEAAKAAKAAKMSTVFGAPNILRGKSQSGSMKAIDAIENGVADCLCADYSPAALIVAVFKIPELLDMSLVEAIKLVTINPAKAARLEDRGEISVGKRADLIAVSSPGRLPQISKTWSAGELVFQAQYDHG
ncbi:alpha-D-ribose 1-methylphosphonate 5-triphosphate diphosphatase [Catenovulum sp. SM1970]|uniref:alpha-D-ribose 1-methylphosphonate 5-triphosphate diphosphatase n=1 Tax=Marinifaba aquimaris TaxID=2741323 RepID=UPI001574205B|nr:alpha-D-ribose 1-methylphosphonate 5-triphosphate diphosphatase [Marinifaba aquimaris]NTS78866.1 alpha-D-ribose 1-methylphosphonate 5-triphosphate diphosphatase [Marinifaba aquimaris]